MNERIKEIILEHGLGKLGCTSRMEMLAELIVKECAEMGDNFDGQPASNAVRKYLTAGDAIREHFGVETNEQRN